MHSTGYKVNQPLSEEDFTVLLTMNADDFFNMIENVNLRPLVTDHHFLNNLSIFFEGTLTERVTSNREFMQKIISLLRMMLLCIRKTVRYTVSVITFNIIQCILKVKVPMPRPSSSSSLESVLPLTEDTLQSISPYMEIVMFCLSDESFQVRKNSTELYWELFMKFPSLFLSKLYLQRMFRMTFDINYRIQIFVIKAFGSLAERKDLMDHSDFWYEVGEALFLRTEDSDEYVAVEAVNSLKHLYKIMSGFFNWEKIMKIVRLIFVERRLVNPAAASLLHLILEPFPGQEFFKKLFEILDKYEDDYMVEFDATFIGVFLPVAPNILQNWKLWLDLLISEDFRDWHKIRICNFLTHVIQESTMFKGEMCDHFPVEQIAGLNQAEKNDYDTRKLHLNAISNQFANSFPMLWEYYKGDESCLKYLVKIPKYCDIEQMDSLEVYSYLVTLKCESESCIDEIYSALSNILRRMTLLVRWYDYVPLMEKAVIDNVRKRFVKSCQMIVSSPINPVSKWSITLKKAVKLSEHFNLTEKGSTFQTFEAFNFGIAHENAQIINTALHMCFFVIEKQVSYVASGNHFLHNLHLQECLKTLESNVTKFMCLLEALFHTDNHSLRIHVYTGLCKIYFLFSPRSEFAIRFPQLMRPKPSMALVEWLQLFFQQLSERKNDHESYNTIKSALQNFCLLLTAEVMPLLSISTVLPFFTCYSFEKNENYNAILQPTLEKLYEIPSSVVVFLRALEMCCQERSLQETEVIAEGIINVSILKLHTEDRIQSLCDEIVEEGVSFIHIHEHFPLFAVISHFMRLMSPHHASDLFVRVLYDYAFPLDDFYVHNFIVNLNERSDDRSNS